MTTDPIDRTAPAVTGSAAAGRADAADAGHEREVARRQQILDAAATVFGGRGFHGARIDDIAASAGLSKGAIYWYFRSKEELAIALAERAIAREDRREAELLAEAGPLRDRLDRYLDDVARPLTAAVEAAMLSLELLSLGDRIARLGPLLAQHDRDCTKVLTEVLREATELFLDGLVPRGQR
jgi:AcrR family transcriptional regulator